MDNQNNRQTPSPWSNTSQNDRRDPWNTNQPSEARNQWGSEPQASEPQKDTNNEQLMNSFLEKCFSRINTQVASTISQQVEEAVQRSLRPIREKSILSVAPPDVSNKSTTNINQQEDLSSILTLLKQLLPAPK